MKLTELENEALRLDPRSRARLAERLLGSLDDLAESEIEELWLHSRQDVAFFASSARIGWCTSFCLPHSDGLPHPPGCGCRRAATFKSLQHGSRVSPQSPTAGGARHGGRRSTRLATRVRRPAQSGG